MRQIRQVKIKPDLSEVQIKFVEVGEIASEEEDDVITNEFSTKSKIRPHKDFVDAMKKLRKLALDVCEMPIDSKQVIFWNVIGISIQGDMSMHQSRIVMTLAKQVKRTNKMISFKTPQVTMFPEKDDESRYGKAEELTKLVEEVCSEAMLYLTGKYEEEGGQLPLFVFAKEEEYA